MPRPIRKKWVRFTLVLLLALYIGSYLLLSRRGFHISDEYGMKGFVFCPLRDPASFRLHFACVVFYAPLIVVDNLVGTGRRPDLNEPM